MMLDDSVEVETNRLLPEERRRPAKDPFLSSPDRCPVAGNTSGTWDQGATSVFR